jgi:N-acetylglucosaminyldiphosphoundecaprenol N-acetyl-beta-D-mannosaminyltransferase
MPDTLPKADLLGVGVTLATPEAIADRIGGVIREGRTAQAVAAVNVHTFIEASRSPRYRTALNHAAVSFVDGVPIRWLMRACGLEAPPRVHGADLTRLVLDRLPDARHLFFGSTPETLGLLEEELRRRYPNLRVAGFISPPFRKSVAAETGDMLRRLNTSGADILWVALGAPKQELWAYLNRELVTVPVIMCVGAVFEIYAGKFSRAPRWLQRLGLEWAWRLAQDPWRLWRRYFTTNGRFLVMLLMSWIRGGRS